jgi:hypothetical protein
MSVGQRILNEISDSKAEFGWRTMMSVGAKDAPHVCAAIVAQLAILPAALAGSCVGCPPNEPRVVNLYKNIILCSIIDSEYDLDDVVVEKHIGRVTKVDGTHGDIVVDYGRVNGAELGMAVKVNRPSSEPGEPAGTDLAWYEIKSVRERECTAKLVRKDIPHWRVQPGDRVIDVTDELAFQIRKLGESNSPMALDELKQTRVNAARRWLEDARMSFEMGTATVDRYIDASKALMEAERDTARDQEASTDAIREHLSRLTWMITFVSNQTGIENDTREILSGLRYYQVEAAQMLLEARRKRAKQ